MIPYTHTLPEHAQQQGVDTIQVTRMVTEPSFVHAWVAYGTVDGEGPFQENGLVGTHELAISDVDAFGQSSSSIDTLPPTKDDTLQAVMEEVCAHADANGLWHTQQ